MVSAVLSDRPVNVAMPPETVTVVVPCSGPAAALERAVTCGGVVAGARGCRTGPRHRSTGCVLKATPAVAVGEGCVLIPTGSHAAGLTTMLLDVAAARTGELVNWSVIVSALLSERSVNVATPPEAVTVVVPCSGPEPIGKAAAVTCVVLSPVSRLPYGSST